eukprot:COSAG06_NODE_10109_length_1749_cov_0.809091_2_plen_117_part_00
MLCDGRKPRHFTATGIPLCLAEIDRDTHAGIPSATALEDGCALLKTIAGDPAHRLDWQHEGPYIIRYPPALERCDRCLQCRSEPLGRFQNARQLKCLYLSMQPSSSSKRRQNANSD